jgi:single-stranded-DNA-specific exonuclease
MGKLLITKVAGVSFEGRQAIIDKMTGREPIRLIPEPTNQFDKNAIGVWTVLADGTKAQIGFVPRDLAAKIAPLIDGEQVMARLVALTGGFETWEGETAALGLRIEIEIPQDANV